MRRQDMSLVGEQRMRNAESATTLLEIADFAFVSAVKRHLGTAVQTEPIASGVFWMCVDALEQGGRVGMSSLRGEFSGRHVEIAPDDGVHDQVIVAVIGSFGMGSRILGERANPCGRATSFSFLSGLPTKNEKSRRSSQGAAALMGTSWS
jgi:hypothetical protein